MSQQTRSLLIRIDTADKPTLSEALADWLERLKNDLSRKYDANAPEQDTREAEHRAHTVGDFVRSVTTADTHDTEVVISHDTDRYDVLHEELSRLYVEFSHRDRPEARERVRDEPIENIVQWIAAEAQVN